MIAKALSHDRACSSSTSRRRVVFYCRIAPRDVGCGEGAAPRRRHHHTHDHYIEEAEAIADRIAVINRGEDPACREDR